MCVSTEIGKIVHDYWHEIPNHFPFVILDAFVVMPNHIHGIIIINKNGNAGNGNTGNGNVVNGNVETHNLCVSTNQRQTTNASKKWKPSTLGVIVNQYKRICTINARKINPNFAWQSNYYEHIIKDNLSFERIRNYIINNPLNWNDDKFYK